MKHSAVIVTETIENKIFLIRGQKVIIDYDIAKIFGIATKVLNQAVKRNIDRFPRDFMFVLTKTEKNELVTNCDRFNSLKHFTALPMRLQSMVRRCLCRFNFIKSGRK